jgi:hypothetical protein
VTDSNITDSNVVAAPGGDDVVLRVESAAAGVTGLSSGPLAEAVTRFEVLHRELQTALADLDQA